MKNVKGNNYLPTYIAQSSEISGSKIEGVSMIGATVYLTDVATSGSNPWRIVAEDLTLVNFFWPTKAV